MINKEDLIDLNIKPIEYKKEKNTIFIKDKNNNKYIFKEKKEDLNDKFKYLISRNYNYFPNFYETNNYNVYKYEENYSIPTEEQAIDLINLISILHLKTTYYKKTDIDDYKIIYEDIENKIKDLKDYFTNLNNLIEEDIFMSPSEYLLIRNISKIYSNLEYCNKSLENWYEKVKDKDSKRVAFIHNNLDLSHIIKNKKEYLISWDKSKFDIPIYDLYNFYKNSYEDIDFTSLLYIYEQRYPLEEDERNLLFLLISLPYKIEFIKDDFINTSNVNKLLKYIYQTDKLISEYNT